MKTITIILMVLLLSLGIFAAGCQCQQQQPSGSIAMEKANLSNWAQTTTGFYRPVYSP